MCTLVVAFYPQSDYPLCIAANRDENPTRPAKPWKLQPRDVDKIHNPFTKEDIYIPQIYCPIDVRGGTWVGCNNFGIFAAITNWDLPVQKTLHGQGLASRGNLVLDLLKMHDVWQITDLLAYLHPKDYKPFNIIFGSKDFLFNLNNDHESINLTKLKTGVHISTGWGLNCDITRDLYIRETLTRSFGNFSKPVSRDALRGTMRAHNDGKGSEHSICVHDDEHRWETRSSSFLELMDDRWFIEHCDVPPCVADDDPNDRLWETTLLLIAEEAR